MSRLFIALPIPAAVAEPLARLRLSLPDARWQHRDDLHITLAFLGEIPDDKAEALADELAQIKCPPIPLKVNRLDAFASGDKARILWAGIDEASAPGLFTLQKKVRAACRKVGIELEARRYRPHITLARLKHTSSAALAQELAAADLPDTKGWSAGKLSIYESRLSPSGAKYARLLDLDFAPDHPSDAPTPR
ncbi:MAG: RNA 2',3'-cyclic phosphodiesterase [Alphaproteobacteria bacterium]